MTISFCRYSTDSSGLALLSTWVQRSSQLWYFKNIWMFPHNRVSTAKLSWRVGSLLRVSLRVAAQSLTTAQWSHTLSLFLAYRRTQVQGGVSGPWNSTGEVPWREMAVTTITCWSSTDSPVLHMMSSVYLFPLGSVQLPRGIWVSEKWHAMPQLCGLVPFV